MSLIVPIMASAAGTAVLAAYLNAKYHIAHDVKNMSSGLSQYRKCMRFMADRAAQKRVLVYHVFEDQVGKQPDHPFLIFEGRTWSYKEFFEAFMRVATWLIDELDVQVGEVVAIDGGNSPEYLMLWFALDAIGATTSFINWQLTGAGLVHCTKVCLCILVWWRTMANRSASCASRDISSWTLISKPTSSRAVPNLRKQISRFSTTIHPSSRLYRRVRPLQAVAMRTSH